MGLSEEQLQHYFREGYVVVPGLIPTTSIRAVMEAAPPPHSNSEHWQARVFDHADPDKDAPIHRLLVEPSVIEAAADIFSVPPRVYYGMLAMVPARGGHGLPWHQDNQYTLLLPCALNIFIALSEITPEKANLWVAPRSHWLGTQPSKTNETTAPGHREAVVEPDNVIPLPTLQPGDVCVFDRNTYHRSLRNETDEHRYAYAAQYQPEHARRASTGQRDPSRMLATDLRRRWLEAGLLR